MKRILLIGLIVFTLFNLSIPSISAKETAKIIPIAIFSFEERGSGVTGYGKKISDIIFANLAADSKIYLVDRSELKKTLNEQELNISGAVSTGQAIQVGQITGAKILISGSVIEADKTLYIVAKIIGSETTRVLGESKKGKTKDSIATLAEALSEKIRKTIHTKADILIAPDVKPTDRIKSINKALGRAKRPVVTVRITERHVGQVTIDPAAETEMIVLCKETGFEVLDMINGGDKSADIIIEGEGFSEFAMRRGNLISVKARLEVKAVERATGKVIAIDRYTAVEIDLTEQIAGKKALQKASAKISERLLPKLVLK